MQVRRKQSSGRLVRNPAGERSPGASYPDIRKPFMTDHKIVSNTEWLAARKALFTKEKELSRLRDELTEQRQQLPWEKG
jgi:hypothetical protein